MSEHTSLKAFTQFRSLFCSLVFDPELTLGQVTSTKWIAEVVAQEVGKTCDRIFSPLVTLALFLGQVLSDDHSCRAVVLRLLAWRAARGLPKCSADTGGYCKARRRLPDSLLPRLVRESADRHETHQSSDWLFHGRRVVIADGSTASMPDTPANQRAFPQHSNQKRGCGFPIARIVVLLSLATGSVIDAAIGASKGKLTGEHALLRSLHRRLKPGDVLLADAYYSSFDAIMALVQMGVDVVMRQTANRPTDFRQGIQLGREDHLIEWRRHRNRWRWMSREAFADLPRVLLMRELRVRVEKRGFRTKEFVVVTTLLDAKAYPREQLAGLYRARWHAELDISSIKQTMKMDVLRCKTPDLVRKEIWAHLLVYNLIRGAMAEAARQHNVMPRQLSLQGARQTLQAFRAELKRVPAKVAAVLRATALEAMAAQRVGDRPDRAEPRVVKRRPKPYPRMQVPRKLARKRLREAA
jgi:Transposase DDE domain